MPAARMQQCADGWRCARQHAEDTNRCDKLRVQTVLEAVVRRLKLGREERIVLKTFPDEVLIGVPKVGEQSAHGRANLMNLKRAGRLSDQELSKPDVIVMASVELPQNSAK